MKKVLKTTSKHLYHPNQLMKIPDPVKIKRYHWDGNENLEPVLCENIKSSITGAHCLLSLSKLTSKSCLTVCESYIGLVSNLISLQNQRGYKSFSILRDHLKRTWIRLVEECNLPLLNMTSDPDKILQQSLIIIKTENAGKVQTAFCEGRNSVNVVNGH